MANIAGIMELYTAYFNRVADKDGVDYWANEMDNNGWSLEDVAGSFAQQTEYTTIYSGKTNAEIVAMVYNNVLGRDADADGAAYWEKDLTDGNVTVDKLIVAVVNAANENGGDDAAADAAVETIGSTIVFTDGIDALVGTTGNDTFVGDNTSTSSAADQVAGGQGTDTVKIYNDGATALTLPVMDSVENLYVKGAVPGTALNVSGLTIEQLELDTLDVDGNATTITYAAGQSIVLDSVQDSDVDTDAGNNAQAVTLAANKATVTELNVTIDGVSGTDKDNTTAQAESLTIANTGAGVKTLNLTVSGDDSSAIFTNAAYTAINVMGDATATIDVTAATALATYDASTATADVTADLSSSTKNIDVKGSAGADTITVDLATDITVATNAGDDVVTLANGLTANLTALDTIDGGEGTDTISVTAAQADSLDGSTKLAQITNFEELRITNDISTVGATTIDVSKFGFNGVQLSAATTNGADATIKGLTSGATVEYRSNANSTEKVTIAMTGATGAGTNDDTLNIDLNADLTGATATTDNSFIVDVEGINIINVSSNDRKNVDAASDAADGYQLVLGKDANVSEINVDGANALNYAVTGTATSLATVDASASEGDMTINLSAFAGTQGIVYKGSEGIDTVTSTKFADVITLGAGKDVYNATNAASNSTALDSITDFDISASGDKIDTAGTATAMVAADVTKVDVSAADSTAKATDIVASIRDGIVTISGEDAAEIDTLAEWVNVLLVNGLVVTGDANNNIIKTAAFEFDGNTYLTTVSDTGNANTETTTVELTGLTGIASVSETNVADSIFIG